MTPMPDGSVSHPTWQQLSDYALGKRPGEWARGLAGRLEAGPECGRKVGGQAAASFVGRLRAAAPRGTTPAGTPAVREGDTPPPLPAKKPPAPADVPPELAAS